MNRKLTYSITDENAVPYFMWDYFLTNKEIKEILNSSNDEKKIWLIAKIMRDARFEDRMMIKKISKEELLEFREKLIKELLLSVNE